jgi:DNA primase
LVFPDDGTCNRSNRRHPSPLAWGSKFAVTGGKEGLFIPTTEHIPGIPLIITEGATDAAALLDLGFPNVVGRPSCTGGTKHLIALIRSRCTNGLVIFGDADESGRRGASNLASVLRVYLPAVQVIEPPGGMKDLRAWKQAGATRADIVQLIQAAPLLRLAIRTTMRGQR